MHTIDLSSKFISELVSSLSELVCLLNDFRSPFLSEVSKATDLQAEQMTSRTQILIAKQANPLKLKSGRKKNTMSPIIAAIASGLLINKTKAENDECNLICSQQKSSGRKKN